MNLRPRVVLVGGGARSGKSAFALRRACALGHRRVFLATAESLDAEMAARIRHHRAERGTAFCTIETPTAVVSALRELPDADVVVVDCLTLWLSNLLLQESGSEALQSEVEALGRVVRDAAFHTVLVSNEVGQGLVPDSALGRTFRDAAGRMHQHMAALADEVYFAAVGMVVRLRPGPISACSPTEDSP